jgi:hypothetical protein
MTLIPGVNNPLESRLNKSSHLQPATSINSVIRNKNTINIIGANTKIVSSFIPFTYKSGKN